MRKSAPRAASAHAHDFDVALPRALRRFGSSVTASLVGPEDAPVIVMLGGISANRHPCLTVDGESGWWSDLAGSNRAIDPAQVAILGMDFAADESGHLAPSTFDQAAVLGAVLDAAGIARVLAIVGASYGGMTALAFAERFPDRVEKLIIVSAPGEPHPTATATRELQRRIVALGLANDAGPEALGIARGLAMLTYRSPQEFDQRFTGGIESENALARSEPGAYLHARGQAYRTVMSPGRFVSLSASIDRHRVDPSQIQTPALIIGAATDQLVPASQLQSLAKNYGGPCTLTLLPSLYGHDMFLKETDKLAELVAPFLRMNS
jgi:homoserine O-acetyltransferase